MSDSRISYLWKYLKENEKDSKFSEFKLDNYVIDIRAGKDDHGILIGINHAENINYFYDMFQITIFDNYEGDINYSGNMLVDFHLVGKSIEILPSIFDEPLYHISATLNDNVLNARIKLFDEDEVLLNITITFGLIKIESKNNTFSAVFDNKFVKVCSHAEYYDEIDY